MYSRYGIGQAVVFSSCGFYLSIYPSIFFFSSTNPSSLTLDVYHTSTHGVGSENLECRSETCCARLAGNARSKKSSKIGHLGTIPQICRAITSQLRNVPTIGNHLLSSNISSTRHHNNYGELSPTSGWDRSGSLGHPCKFQRVSRLDSVNARQCSSRRQPNCAACVIFFDALTGAHH